MHVVFATAVRVFSSTVLLLRTQHSILADLYTVRRRLKLVVMLPCLSSFILLWWRRWPPHSVVFALN